MILLKPIAVVFGVTLCLLLSDCQSPTAPSVPQGRRDYAWTYDTLQYILGDMVNTLWGSSPTDLWTGGGRNLFHYDGHLWTRTEPRLPCDVDKIWGFSPTDVWVGGNNGTIMHYDGVSWRKSYVYAGRGNETAGIWINGLHGTQWNDLYAVGGEFINFDQSKQHGFVLHYDGTTWKEVLSTSFSSEFLTVTCENGNAFVWSLNADEAGRSSSDAIYRLKDGLLSEIFRPSTFTQYSTVGSLNGHVVFVLPQGICRYDESQVMSENGTILSTGSFIREFSIDDPYFSQAVCGRSLNDVFAIMHGGIAHWNGTDLTYLLRLDDPYTFIPGRAIFAKDVFFAINDGSGTNIVAHGRLAD